MLPAMDALSLLSFPMKRLAVALRRELSPVAFAFGGSDRKSPSAFLLLWKKNHILRPVLTALVAGAFLAGCRSGALAPQAIVVGDIPPANAPGPAPSREKPLYYYPVVGGYRELGAKMAGVHPPSSNEVLRAVAKALAQENYLLVRPGVKPDLMMVIWWGCMNPLVEEFEQTEEEVAPTKVFFNMREMLALVGAFKADVGVERVRNDLRQAANDDRYFIVVGAYDFAAVEKHERKLLWSARMSTESTGRSPEEIFPLLAASGAAVFGRETKPGVIDTAQQMKGTRVDLGELQVIENLTKDQVPAKK